MAEEKEKKNEYSTFAWAIGILTCVTSSCAAIIAAIALVILISQHWTQTNTITQT